MTVDIEAFTRQKITKRLESLIQPDLEKYDRQIGEVLDGASVLVVGGAGSIGSSYIKALLKKKIKKLVAIDTNENGLTELVRELRSTYGLNVPDDFITYPVNYGSAVAGKILKAHGPFDVIANFAAHKHVRSEKDIFSIEAMLENNVFKAKDFLDRLVELQQRRYFCVSTDKAANPVNIMGASKKLMEELILAYSDRMIISTARFANVAFSNGSLLSGFLTRIEKRQPWSCPRGIKRFFVSPAESGQLCLVASVLANTGEIFFPKLDEKKDMISLEYVALELLSYLGLEPVMCGSEEEAKERMSGMFAGNSKGTTKAWPLYLFDSDTSGEKTFEEFYTESERLDLEKYINLGVIKKTASHGIEELNLVINRLKMLFDTDTVRKADVVDSLKMFIPDFHHIETGKSLDQKM